MLDRYHKQTRFSPWGEAAQQALRRSRVLVVGCGALGSVQCDALVRAGVGFLRIVDRDFVEVSNLQRQVLFDENDVRSNLPKAIAAVRKLEQINSEVELEPHVADVSPRNIRELMRDVDLILDGTDNFETRFLINDAALEAGLPWVNGGVIGGNGQVFAIVPGCTPCLRCLIPDVPPPGSTETCDTAGVLGPAVNVVASLQVIAAMKLLAGIEGAIDRTLRIVDVWDGSIRPMRLAEDLSQRVDCPACRRGEWLWLNGDRGSQSTVLCGRNSVQIAPPEAMTLSLEELEHKLRPSGDVMRNPFLLRLKPAGSTCELTFFRDGRAIVQGTEEISVAKTLYARYIGS